MSCGLKPRLMCLDFESKGALHLCTSSKRKALGDRFEEWILIGSGSGNIHRLLTKKTRKFIIARDVKLDLGELMNKAEPLYNYDNEDKKDLPSTNQKKCNQC